MTESIIEFRNISKWYPLYRPITGGLKWFIFSMPKALQQIRHMRSEALRRISFRVYKGETFGIIGRNGAGKSTTLGLIAGVIRPSQGSIKDGVEFRSSWSWVPDSIRT